MGSTKVSMDPFYGAIYRLGSILDKTGEKVGIPRTALAAAFQKHYRRRGADWETAFWATAGSNSRLGKWIWKQKKLKFDAADEMEFLELSDQIPTKVREGLIEIAKCLPGRRGGKARVLDMVQAWQARTRISKLRVTGLSRRDAYKKVAKEIGVSEHTIRRINEPKERKRSTRARSSQM